MLVMETECKPWHLPGRTEKGYGQKGWKGKTWKAHRWVWTQEVGPIPDGLHVLHHCGNHECVNVDHLYLDTQARRAARITHCPRGHAYDEENTYRSKKGKRGCRKCIRAYNAAYYQKRKAS